MDQPNVKKASEFYKNGEFNKALNVYQMLSASLARKCFIANIYLCEKSLNLKDKSYQSTSEAIQAISGNRDTHRLFPEEFLGKENANSSRESTTIDLCKDKTIKFIADVVGKGTISIHVEIDAEHEETNSKVALLEAKFFDSDQRELKFKHPSFGHSEKFQNYKYLQANENRIELIIPEKCEHIEFNVRKWLADCRVSLRSPISCYRTSEQIVSRLSEWSVADFTIPTVIARQDSPLAISIMDEFSENTFAYDMRLLAISPEDWREEISKVNPDLLFVESAWKGNRGAWQYALTNPRNTRHEELIKLINECKRRNIPTVFWNKEDPPNFNIFIDSAKYFDYVFTTDSNCVEEYKRNCGHDRVFSLPFAAQPKIHNPIGKIENEKCEVAFAGTWYAKKHKERCELAPILFTPASSRGLTIFNRMSDWTQDDSYDYPDEYKPFVKPKISYHEMLSAHKMFKVFLNINSVTDSPTMFSRRIFEVLASSTPVISTASIGVEKIFGGIVPVVKSAEDAANELGRLLDDSFYRKKVGHWGHREVMQNQTVRHRLQFVFDNLGIGYRAYDMPKVTWAVPTNRPAHLKYIIENFNRQDYSNLELIIALNSDDFDKRDVEMAFNQDQRVKIIQLPESCTLGEVLNATIDEMSGEYWMKIDDDNIYLDKFTSDMMLPFLYTDVGIVGKGSYFAYLEESDETFLRFPGQDHEYVTFCSGSALAVKKRIFNIARFPDQSVGEDTIWMKECVSNGERMYSPDIFNYAVVRRASKDTHTWKIDDDALKKSALFVGKGKCLDLIQA